MKDPCRDKSKAKASISTFIQDSKLSDKARKNKKKAAQSQASIHPGQRS